MDPYDPFHHRNAHCSSMSPHPSHPVFVDAPPPFQFHPPPPRHHHRPPEADHAFFHPGAPPPPPLHPPPPPHPIRRSRGGDQPFEFDPNWEREHRRPMTPSPMAGVPMGRKRPRWDQDRVFEEEPSGSRRGPRRLGFADAHSRRDGFFDPSMSDPPVLSPRVVSGARLGPNRAAFVVDRREEIVPWESWSDARPPPPPPPYHGEDSIEGTRGGFMEGSPWRSWDDAPASYQIADGIHESLRSGFVPPNRVEEYWTDERRPLLPPYRKFENLHPGMEGALEEGLAGREFQEDKVLVNKGKRMVLNGRGAGSPTITPTKRFQRKPSALSRIQSGVSVWERIEEKPQPFVPSLHGGVSEEQQPEMEHLDLSYKSNALVAKVLPPPNHVGPSSDGKGVVSRTLKKVVKKKVVKPREKVVPVSLNVSTSGVSEVVPKKPLLSGSLKYSNKELERVLVSSSVVPDSLKASCSRASKEVCKRSLVSHSPGKLSSKLSENVVASSAVVPCSSSTKPGPKKVKLMGSAGKSSLKISTKSKPSVEVQKKEITRCLDTFNSEMKTKTMDDGASRVCCQELTKDMEPIENNVTVQSTEFISTAELSSDEVIRRDENKAIAEKVHGMCADDTVVSGTEILGSVHSNGNLNTSHLDGKVLNGFSLEKGTTGSMLPLTDGGVEGSAQVTTAAEHGTSKGPCEELACRMSDIESSANFVRLGEHFNDAYPLTLEDGEQIIPPADSVEGEVIVQKVEDERHILDACVHTEDAKLLEGSGSPSCGVVSNSHANDISAPLPLESSEVDLESIQPLGAKDCAPSIQDMEGMQQQCDHFNLVGTKAIAVASYADKNIKDLVHSQVSDMDSLTVIYDAQDVGCSVDAELSDSCFSDLKSCNDDKDNSNQEERLTTRDDSSVVSVQHLASEAEEVKSARILPCHQEISELLQEGLSQGSTKQIAPVLRAVEEEEFMSRKGLAETGNIRILPHKGCLVVKEASHLNRNLRNKTWHRTESTASASLPHGNLHSTSRLLGKQSSKKLERVQNSYIRKGNSLIRKSLSVQQPPQLKSVANGEIKIQKLSSKGFDGKIDAASHPTSNPYFVTKNRPNSPLQIKSPSLSSNLPEDDTHDIPEALTYEGGVETQVKQPKSQIADLILGSNVDGQSIQPIRKSEPFDSKKIRYVKRKSNQLVAAPEPDSVDLSTHTIDNVQKISSCAPSDLYYRKKKNQLIRNASCDLQKQDATSPTDNSNSDDQRIPIISSLKASTRGPFKKRLDKVLQKKYKHSSLVWTLGGGESQKKGFSSVNSWKVLPSLFPWKRAIYWKSSSNIPSTSNKNSLSSISRRLQLTRRRNTVYTVSTDGFSIRKAGVISIGGSSLKWSKSIERRSKKANEEATLAVAEVERMKRERKRAAHVRPNKKNGNCLLRERIFRVGSARYKMDPSKRTLIRISDDQLSSAADQQGVNKLRSFVPRRLLIGNDEYIRIGNGNQLVRDPKKLIRILASEKVRWSLHTARLKLAKKQQYCQFFTRFGKCNKNGGKCPYIHDPTKIAICTKFLRGLCSNTNCKLTHKVQPERMPDCSYFLRGLCTNMTCPYRHVNVNPKAVVCEGFLKGYCVDGDECCKKHSYVCPVFEATGKCPQGSKCKLHHPKSINKTKKRKQTTIQISSNKRRYFGSSITEAVKPLNVAYDKNDVAGGDLFCCDGRFTDFVSLDANSDEDGADVTVSMDSSTMPCDSELSDQQPEDVEALIKPVHLLYTTKLTIPSANQ